MMLPVGHIDFYPNGGKDQPGCPRQSFMNIITEEYEDGTSGKLHAKEKEECHCVSSVHCIMSEREATEINFISHNFRIYF